MFFILLFPFLFSTCKKAKLELEKLPPETQIGAQTFGCLVNGKALVPKLSLLSQIPSPRLEPVSFYFKSDSNTMDFSVKGIRDVTNEPDMRVSLYVKGIDIIEGVVLMIKEEHTEKAWGHFYGSLNLNSYNTYYNSKENLGGEIWLKKFNDSIIAGTFWFNAVNSNYDTLKITDGRFDIKIR